jgi:hypothetical protein
MGYDKSWDIKLHEVKDSGISPKVPTSNDETMSYQQ